MTENHRAPLGGLTPERWSAVLPLLDAVIDLELGDAVTQVQRLAPDAPALRADVLALRQSARATSFLDHGADPLMAALFAGLADDSADAISEIGRFEVREVIARGGMGIVYRAFDPKLGRTVALKLLPHSVSTENIDAERFLQEARAASALDHPNVETVYDVGETPDGRLFMALAHYDGPTLQERIEHGAPGLTEVIALAAQVADGLAAVHRAGIAHRDIKPANLVLSGDGIVKIIDFGIAKASRVEQSVGDAVLGTVSYMSPEQSRGDAVDHRTDIWSLGVVLYEMLTGNKPFVAATPPELLRQIRSGTAPPVAERRPDVPPALSAIVERCLAKLPDDRYDSADVLAAHLRSLQLSTSSANAAPVGRWDARRVGRVQHIIAGVVALLVMFTVVALVRHYDRADVMPVASSIAVLPFAPVTADTSTARLGRDLAITVAATVDGVGNIRTAEPLTILAQVDRGAIRSFDIDRSLANGLNARSFLRGTLVRMGDSVRLDLALFETASGDQLARMGVAGRVDDIVGLSDSTAFELLRAVWRRGEAPPPSIAAVTTQSVPALRAYLAGEDALAGADFVAAVHLFEEAFAIDSSFWIAYWRSIYPRVYEGSPADSATMARLLAHRGELPEADRLLIEAGYTSDTTDTRLGRLRRLANRYPSYWPAAYELANSLVHFGPYVGTELHESRAALERFVRLNPGFAPAWEHLSWIALLQRDTVGAAVALQQWRRRVDPAPSEPSSAELALTLLRNPGRVGTGVMDAVRPVVLEHVLPLSPEVLGTTFLTYGLPAATVLLADSVLALGPGAATAGGFWLGKAFAWAARGGWDSTAVALSEAIPLSGDRWYPLRAYGLMAAGVVLGSVAPQTAAGWRASASAAALAPAAHGGIEANSSPHAARRAELAWLDGILSFARRDRNGVVQARHRVEQAGADFSPQLQRSLTAFEAALGGDSAGAARALADLELEVARTGAASGRDHPFTASVHRLAASRWLLAVGDTAAAERLLPWHEAVLWQIHELIGAANRAFAPLALIEQARIANARGRHADAERHYRALLWSYDRPPARHAPWLAEARRVLETSPAPAERR